MNEHDEAYVEYLLYKDITDEDLMSRRHILPKAKNIYLSGKLAWAHRLFEPDNFKGKEFWSVTLYPDPKSWEVFKAMRLQQKVKEDNDGKFIQLKRPCVKPWAVKHNENPRFDAPPVTDAAGNAWDTDNLIGNGSAGTLKVEVYHTKDGPGARIIAVRIDDWIEYIAPEAAPEEAPVEQVVQGKAKQTSSAIPF